MHQHPRLPAVTGNLRKLPVSARADSLSYRTQRFVRRNRGPVAVSAILVAFAIVASVTAWRESAIARVEARRTARVASFLQAVLGSADVRVQAGVMPRLGPNVTVSVLLDSALRRVASSQAWD